MKDETGVKIDSGELLSALECTICYNAYNEPTTTKCGHTYCKACIEACINRNHECPDCKTSLNLTDTMRNIQIERMQRQITELQEKAKKDPLGGEVVAGYVMSPVVNIFQENLRNCMARFDQYNQKLKEDMEDIKRKVKAGYEGNAEVRLAEIDKKYKSVIDMVINEYDKHMKDGVPEPKIPTVKLVLQVPSKAIRIENVNLRPYDTMKELKALVEKQLEIQKNPVLKWGANIRYVVFGPSLGAAKAVEEAKSAFEIVDEIKPIYELNIASGSRVVVEGTIICESDASKPCITLKFKPEEKKAYDYYSCDKCMINWICEPCAQQCHKDHEVKLYLKAHVPQWACCYCLKKGCRIQNKNNPNVPMID